MRVSEIVAFHRTATSVLLDPTTHLDAFVNGALLAAPLYTASAIFLFMWTGLPAFLLYACLGGVGNVVLVRSLIAAEVAP